MSTLGAPDPWAGAVRGSRPAPLEPRSVDGQPFLDAMARLAGGVVVLTTRDVVGRDCGITVTACSAVSLDPPLVLVSVRRSGFVHDALSVSEGWAMTMLATDQVDLARYASRHRAPGDRDDFSRWPHLRGSRTDALLFAGGVAAVECVPYDSLDAGDHTIVVGRVVAATADPAGQPPLVYVDRGYATAPRSSG